MIRLKDLIKEHVNFYGKAKVVLFGTSKAKDAKLPSSFVEFRF